MRPVVSQVPGDIMSHMKASAVGKMSVEVKRAYLAGLIDGDGCIMATIERHSEKKFGFRVRVEVKITQKENRLLNCFAQELKMGRVNCNRTGSLHAAYDWIVRDKNDLETILKYIQPYTRLKQEQVDLALRILHSSIETRQDLINCAQMADALSKLNVRSRNRRKNFATMIQTRISPND